MEKEKQVPRRDFIKTSALVATAVAVPTLLSTGCAEEKQEQEEKKWPEGKLNIAVVGIGMGWGNMKNCMDENIVAVCDVDLDRMDKRITSFREEFPDKTVPYQYQDYKKMFSEIGNQIDAVIIATPDHTHANVTLDAMKLGKHVYCQKPLTHSVYESRILTQAAEKYNVATQMGNQGASGDDTYWVCESIWNGDIGEVKEVHAWTNRPIWPQSLSRPDETPAKPKQLDWDSWLGPAPVRPYSPMYHPWSWRGWFDFGTGALGDMACHIFDVIMRSLRLQYPNGIEASSSKWTLESPPESEKVTYYFPAREKYKNVDMPEVKITWYDGGLMPDRPEELEDGEKMGDNDGGVLFVGTKGKIMCGCYAKNAKRLPTKEFKDYKPNISERLVEGGIDGHEKDWIRACKEDAATRVKPKSHFGYAGPFNEVVVMGTVASRLAGLQRVLRWDGENMKFTNIKPGEQIRVAKSIKLDTNRPSPRYNSEYEVIDAYEYAQNLIKRKPRAGWELEL
ncbi:Gfo/Idh/MocA family oxidoreductase [Prolixibacteraceae bacterium Z1-6]|uniref:Gfo/Idh/MocA family oxidoreductase n=1 Tax=Draconibacterium aestuarii TaxID=2998507 RepID=A0A9X3F6I9_9BACT|nr:Gfo/Idh/MocA family oxidoreductase [Prolixibacteraceae bacterium Z1-6]